ncbi:hypothetical protein LZF95_15430 [Algoriphagus sp. AGSA1]|nr:hypothetical protein [Algoriphagus sp. AGSA1]MCE7056073.1 hypothetical protein [Algoriphagus sp. AGSA1]
MSSRPEGEISSDATLITIPANVIGRNEATLSSRRSSLKRSLIDAD